MLRVAWAPRAGRDCSGYELHMQLLSYTPSCVGAQATCRTSQPSCSPVAPAPLPSSCGARPARCPRCARLVWVGPHSPTRRSARSARAARSSPLWTSRPILGSGGALVRRRSLTVIAASVNCRRYARSHRSISTGCRLSRHIAYRRYSVLSHLQHVSFDKCGIAVEVQEAALGTHRRAQRNALAASRTISALRAVQTEGPRGEDGDPPSGRPVLRYSAARMLQLRDSPFSRVPPRLNSLPAAVQRAGGA